MLFYGLFRVHTERGRDKRETRRSRKRSERSDKRLLVTHPGECERGSFIIDIKFFAFTSTRGFVSKRDRSYPTLEEASREGGGQRVVEILSIFGGRTNS